MDQSLDAWFARDVLIHEADLERYLLRTSQVRADIHQLRQETYQRVYEAAARERPRSAKAFLLETARQLLLDRLHHRRQVSSTDTGRDLDDLTVLMGEDLQEREPGANDELSALGQAFNDLPPPCREVVRMRTIEHKSHAEIAASLDLDEALVGKHIATAMCRFADALFGQKSREKPKAELARPVMDDRRAGQLSA